MVWCLLVVPNYCIVDPLAKVNKTAEATQIPLCSTHNWACKDMDTSNNLSLIGLIYFGHSKKKFLRSVDNFLQLLHYDELKIRRRLWASSTQRLPRGLLTVLWILWNSLSGIKTFHVKSALPLFSDDSGCYLLHAPIQTYYVFMSTSFTCHKTPSLCCLLSFCLRSGKATLKCRQQN